MWIEGEDICKYSTMVSALVCHTRDGSSILLTCSNASMAEGFMHQTLNLVIKVRVLVGVQNYWEYSSKVEQLAVNQ